MANTNYLTFEDAVNDMCRDLGLVGHEAAYKRVLIGSLERSTAGIYNISTLVSGNVPEDAARDIKQLNRTMRESETGREMLQKCKIEGDGVPVVRTFMGHGVLNPIFLLPSEGNGLSLSVERLNEAVEWRRKEEIKIGERERKGKER